jgi:RHS repeat-associated protein
MATTQYWYDGTDLICEKDDDGAYREYYHGPEGLLSMYDSAGGGSRRYHFYDGMGSTSELTNESGTELGTYTYDAWGNQLSGPDLTNPFRYIGKHGYYSGAADGMSVLQQRFYRPTLGRFWTRDPIGDLDDANLYRYVHNRPTVQVDPSGLYRLDLETCGEWGRRRKIYELVILDINKALDKPECKAALKEVSCKDYIKKDLIGMKFTCSTNPNVYADTCGETIRVNLGRVNAGDILHEAIHACWNATKRPYNPGFKPWKCPECTLKWQRPDKEEDPLGWRLYPGHDIEWEKAAEKVKHACGFK